MTENVILLIGHAPGRADDLAGDLERTCRLRVQPIAAVEDAVALGGLDTFALILVCPDGSEDRDQFSALLWSLSTARRPVPLIVLCDRYNEADALTYFRMGVTDYLSLTDHREALPVVVGNLIATRFDAIAEDQGPGSSTRGGRGPRSRTVLKRSGWSS